MSKVKSLTDRLSSKFRSLASHIGLSERRTFAELVFASIDTNGDGELDRQEISNWLLDENFIDNPLYSFANNNVSSNDELVSKIMARLSKTLHPTTVSLADFLDYMRTRKPNELHEMTRASLTVTADRKERGIRKVFDAMDVTGDGELDFDAVNVWLKYDAAFMLSQGLTSTLNSEEQRQLLFDTLDRDRDGCLLFADINAYMQAWSVREIRIRTANMRQDAETRKMKHMAELLAASMAQRLGIAYDSNGNGHSQQQRPAANSTSMLLSTPSSGSSRPRSISDVASLPPPASFKVVEVTGSVTARSHDKRIKVPKTHIARQIDELVLQSLALAAENSEINAKRRKLNIVNEKVDRQLVLCERERMKMIVRLTELDGASSGNATDGGLSPSGAAAAAAASTQLEEVEASIAQKQASILALHSKRSAANEHQDVKVLETLDAEVAQEQSTLQLLELERNRRRRLVATAKGFTSPSSSSSPASSDSVRASLNEALEAINQDREQMASQLREMEHQHAQLTRRHVEISLALTNINQQIAILFDGQIHERRQSLGEAAQSSSALHASNPNVNVDAASHDLHSIPVPCVASVECEMDQRKTTGLLNVSNFILMYESRIAGYVGRALPPMSSASGAAQDQSPLSSSASASASASLASSRRASMLAMPASDFTNESCRFCVEMNDVQSVKFIHANDDDGHDEEGYDEEGVASIEHSIKEPSIATLIITLKPHFHNRFLATDHTRDLNDEAVSPSALYSSSSSSAGVTLSPFGAPAIQRAPSPLGSALESTSDLAIGAMIRSSSGNAVQSLPQSQPQPQSQHLPRQHASIVACFGDYDSLRRVDKALRSSMALWEQKQHQAASLRARAASVQISSPLFPSAFSSSSTSSAYAASSAAVSQVSPFSPVHSSESSSSSTPGSNSASGLSPSQLTRDRTAANELDGIMLIGGVSELLSPLNLRRLLSVTHPICGPCPWTLTYSSSQHGASFPFFFNVLADIPYSLVVISAATSSSPSSASSSSSSSTSAPYSPTLKSQLVLGGFCSAPWENHIHNSDTSFYGNKECFVFSVTPAAADEKESMVLHRGESKQSVSLEARAGESSGASFSPDSHRSSEGDSSAGEAHPSLTASSVVVDTMLKATHAVEAASLAGLAVVPAVRRASIDTSSQLTHSSSHGSLQEPLNLEAAAAAVTEVGHKPSVLHVYHASGADDRYMFSSSDAIGMGGADTASNAASAPSSSSETVAEAEAGKQAANEESGAWRLEREFNAGRSLASATFTSPPLTSETLFRCIGIEIWTPIAPRLLPAALQSRSSQISINLFPAQ